MTTIKDLRDDCCQHGENGVKHPGQSPLLVKTPRELAGGGPELERLPVGVRAAQDQAGMITWHPASQPGGERHRGGRLDG